MAIVYQGDQGLIQGINQAGSILGGILMQKAQERTLRNQFSNINKKIEGKPFSPTLLQEILAEPGGQAYLSQFGPIIAPVLKEQARSQGAQAWLKNALPDIFGAPGQPSFPISTPQTPIAEANMMQKEGSGDPRISGIEEARSAQSNVSDNSGVPSRPPLEDSNRDGPREQTIYQQGGQAGMGINPPQEGGDAIRQELTAAARAQPNMIPATAPSAQGMDLTKLSPEQAEKVALVLAGSPYQEHREIAKIIQDQGKFKREQGAKYEERNFQINKPLYEGINAARRSLPEKEIALERIDAAIQSGDIRRFTDWAADRLGMDPLKSTQGQILESAVKTLFLNDLQGIQGGRLNQLIEGNLLKSFQNIGKSPEANQEITETLYAIEDIVKERIKVFDDISEKYDKAGRELPRNVDKMIDDRLNPFVKDKLAELNKVRRELRQGKIRSNSAVQMRRAERKARDNPPPEGTKWVLAPNGQVRAIPLSQLKAATSKEAGGRLVNE